MPAGGGTRQSNQIDGSARRSDHERESWYQNEHYDAGHFEDTLISHTTGMTLTHGGMLRLGDREQLAVWAIAIGTLVTAAATVTLAAIALITCDGG